MRHERLIVGIIAALLLMTVPAQSAMVTEYGDPHRFYYGKVELDTQTSAASAPSSGYVRLWWLDADGDNAVDSGDGLYFRLNGGSALGPFLYSGGSGTYTSWTLAGDSGSSQTISDGNTASIVGGTNGIDTVASATDTLTLNFDASEVGSVTWGTGTSWTFPTSISYVTPFMAFGNDTTNAGRIRLLEDADNGSNYTGIFAPASLAGDTPFTLPNAYPGSTLPLTVDTSGNLGYGSTQLTGSGTANYNAFWTGANTLGGSMDWQFDDTTDTLTIGTVSVAETSNLLTFSADDRLAFTNSGLTATTPVISIDNSSAFGGRGLNISGTSPSAANFASDSTGASGGVVNVYSSGASGANIALVANVDSSNNAAYGVQSDRTRTDEWQDFAEQGSAPANPPSGFTRVYSDNATFEKVRYIDDGGNNYTLANQSQSELMLPVGCAYSTGATTTLVDGRSYIAYVGKAPAPFTSCSVRFQVTTACAGVISWAKVTVLTGNYDFGGTLALTARGSYDASVEFAIPGLYEVPITVSGITPGADIWIAVGTDTDSTITQFDAAVADPLRTGVYQMYIGDASAMSATNTTATHYTSAVMPWIALNVDWQ